MCELFVLSVNKPVMIGFTWHGFRKRGRIRRDDWGIDWYLSNGLVGTIKELHPASDSPIARLMTMTRSIKSKINY